MLTLEFKLDTTPEQERVFERWLQLCSLQWNAILPQLEAFDNSEWNKEYKQRYPACTLNSFYPKRRYQLNKKGGIYRKGEERRGEEYKPTNKFEQASYCPIVSPRTWRIIRRDLKPVKSKKIGDGWGYHYQNPDGSLTLIEPTDERTAETKASWGWYGERVGEDFQCGYSCPVLFYELRIQSCTAGKNAKGGDNLQSLVREDSIPLDKQDLLKLPYWLRNGVACQLARSFEAHINWRKSVSKGESVPVRGFPKYKRGSASTLYHPSPDAKLDLANDSIKLKGFVTVVGALKVVGLSKRWRLKDGSIPKIAEAKITKKGAEWFIQLTTRELSKRVRAKERLRAVGIDFGLHDFLISDWDAELVYPDAKHKHITQRVEIPRFFRQIQDKLAYYQQLRDEKLDKQLILWLNHPDRTIEELRKNHLNVSDRNAELLLSAKTTTAVLEIVSPSTYNYLKHHVVPKSNKVLELDRKIAKLHSKVKRQRKALYHKLAAFYVRYFDLIRVESGLQSQNLRLKAKPTLNEKGTGYDQNRAKAKSGLSKSLADAAHGTFISLLEYEADLAGKKVERVKAAGTSKKCAVCGNEKDMPVEIRVYECEKCGWKCDRDQNAALNVLFSGSIEGLILSPLAQKVLELRSKMGLG